MTDQRISTTVALGLSALSLLLAWGGQHQRRRLTARVEALEQRDGDAPTRAAVPTRQAIDWDRWLSRGAAAVVVVGGLVGLARYLSDRRKLDERIDQLHRQLGNVALLTRGNLGDIGELNRRLDEKGGAS